MSTHIEFFLPSLHKKGIRKNVKENILAVVDT